jgi:hypothetical protein
MNMKKRTQVALAAIIVGAGTEAMGTRTPDGDAEDREMSFAEKKAKLAKMNGGRALGLHEKKKNRTEDGGTTIA